MPKASPMVRSFNAGEFSELLNGRVDLDRYPSSLRSMLNYIAAPQGPAIGRSGTAFVAPVANEAEESKLLAFVFSSTQAKVLEIASDRIRFFDEDGVQVYAPVTATVTSAAEVNIVITATGLDALVGDQVVLSDFPASYNLNGVIAGVTAVAGTSFTLDVVYPDETVVNGKAARVYHVACSYTLEQRTNLRGLQSVDVMYLLSDAANPRKLSRYGTYDWRLEEVYFRDGPYLPINETSTKITPNATGNAIPDMTSNILPSGTAGGSGNRPNIAGSQASPVTFINRRLTYVLDASEFYYAFDNDDETYWAGNVEQSGTIQYTPASAFVCDGYTIYTAKDNQDTSYTSNDYAPSAFAFEGYTGSVWVTLDQQEEYVLYDGGKSAFIQLENTTSYTAYRLRVKKLVRNGLIEPRLRRLVLREKDETGITLTASATEGINDGDGFQSTDVGRLVRLKGSDAAWRSCRITTVSSTTVVIVDLLGEPLLDTGPVREWRLGLWSDTTGWPSTGDFFEDRLWLAGSQEYPDMFAGSVTGGYETFSQTDGFGVVLDDSAIVLQLNARRLSRIQWLSSDTRGIVIGTGSEEYTLSAPSGEALTAKNVRARPATRRGSANVEPVRVDDQALYVQRSGRAVREFAFVFEADGYRSPSMSQLASHLGTLPFVEMQYAAEPHSIVWVRRSDGSLAGLTYNREENVVGWHRHDLSGGKIETMAVIPQKDQLQDALWVVVRRTVGDVTRRYVERLTRFWDFTTVLGDAHFVDSGLRYSGGAIDLVYGLTHLEGQEVYGLADNRPVGPLTVVSGSVTLPYEAENIVLGLGYDAECVVPRLENGAADGTAQGKVKRINSIVLAVWNSFGGEVGVYNEQEARFIYEPLEYPGVFDEIEDVSLHTGLLGPVRPAPGYDMDGIIGFRRSKAIPLPFNMVSIMPQLNTQDR